MTPHCWSSWSITSRGLVDLETTDIAVRRNEKGEVHGINAQTWSSIKRKDRKERGFLIPSSSLATHSKAGHPKWFTFMCLYTKNKKAINNSLYEGVSCTLLLTQLFFSLPSPLSYLFPPWPRGNTRQICHWLDGSRYGEWFSNISLPPMLGISLWALFIILKWSLLHEPHQIKKKKKKSSETATCSNRLPSKCPRVRHQLYPGAARTCKSRPAVQAASTALLQFCSPVFAEALDPLPSNLLPT